ncbi:IS1182 family transposase ISMac2 [Spirochaetia bacterium]|nr:IS1182 family transposase ISMac2 [Spirochaetia bacterium]
MAKYKHTDVESGQGLFLTVNLKEQLLPGTFEYMLNDVLNNKIDLSNFDRNYKNDKTGASAIPPAAIMKLIIYGYSKGRKSSRAIGELAETNIIAKALTGDLRPHWTTVAGFISSNHGEFKEVFVRALAYCNELGLVGGKTFAIDGYRLPSNASLELTGTGEELRKRLGVYKKMAERHIERHKRKDEKGETGEEDTRHYEERQKKLNRGIEKISTFLETMEKREGRNGKERKSNVTDNESALIHTSKGYIQGYIGLAVSDDKNQVIVRAEAAGSANECEHFPRMLEETNKSIEETGIKKKRKATILADSNYFSEENLRAAEAAGMEAIIPDGEYRSRLGKEEERRYNAADFTYHKKGDYYACPDGKRLEYKGLTHLRGRTGKVYQAGVTDCRGCRHYERCIKGKRGKEKIDKGRKILITESNAEGSLCGKMKEKLNREEYRERYSRRLQIIEPVFSDIGYCKGLNRFMLRGKGKVNGQWQLYCIVHNLCKCLKTYNERKNYA